MKKILLLILLLIVGCNNSPETPKNVYATGDIVETVVGHYQGQILIARYHGFRECWYYGVRIDTRQERTNVSLLGTDGPIQKEILTTLDMWEFELQPVKH